jgi:hypothetical protein
MKQSFTLIVALTLIVARPSLAQETPQDLLVDRPLAESTEKLAAQLRATPDDQAVRFALGVAQTCRAVEKTAAALYEHGLLQTSVADNLPIFRLPVPPNPAPKKTTAADVDRILETFANDLADAAKTLEGVNDAGVMLPLRVGRIRLDLDGPAATGGEMSAWEVIADVSGIGRRDPDFRAAAEEFVIGFDLGDAHWLRGYCHLLAGFAQTAAAFEKKELIERVGHLFFADVDSPHAFLRDGSRVFEAAPGVDAVDLIAFVHLLNFPVRDAGLLKSARQHWLATLDCSEQSWRAILAETDDEAEWIPNPSQGTVVPGMEVSKEVIDAWLAFVADGRDVLEGRRLIPFWRGRGGAGVNVRRAFEEPQPFDLVLWVQGTGAAPYIEQGPLADARSLRQLERLLGGQVFLFAVWVN